MTLHRCRPEGELVAGAGAILGVVATILATQDASPTTGISAGATSDGVWLSYESPFSFL